MIPRIGEYRVNKRAWILITILVVIAALSALYLVSHKSSEKETGPSLVVNGLCENFFGGLFTCRADIELHDPIIVTTIALRIGGEETLIDLPTPLMLEQGFVITYTVTPSKASLTIHEMSPPSIITFYTNSIYPQRSMCHLSLVDEKATNLSSGTAFPYETHLQPSSSYAYLAQVITRPPKIGGIETMASIDVKLFLLQDTLAWEFYEAEPAPLLPRVILVPLGGQPIQGNYYTKITILYNKIGDKAPDTIPMELRVYRATPVHLILRLQNGEVIDAVLPLYCH